MLIVLGWSGPPSVDADVPVDEDEVRAMVDALVARIRANHEPTRQWEPEVLPEGNVAQPTGRTALAALALLEAGVPAQSPKLLAAIGLSDDLSRSDLATAAGHALAAR